MSCSIPPAASNCPAMDSLRLVVRCLFTDGVAKEDLAVDLLNALIGHSGVGSAALDVHQQSVVVEYEPGFVESLALSVRQNGA